MDEANLTMAAAALRNAYTHGPIPPLRAFLDPDDGDGAYLIQALNVAIRQQSGRSIIGRKIGLTSPAVQNQLGVSQPDYGVLFDDMRILNGGVLRPSQTIQPKAEAEVALVMARDIDCENTTIEDVRASVETAVAAIEIVDSRIADWKITFADTVADNGSSAFFVLGDSPKPLANLDLYACGMVMEANGAVVSVGAGAACLGHPLAAAAWLARALAKRGELIRAGDIVLTGALGPMVALQPGMTVKATIGGLGEAGFRFEETV